MNLPSHHELVAARLYILPLIAGLLALSGLFLSANLHIIAMAQIREATYGQIVEGFALFNNKPELALASNPLDLDNAEECTLTAPIPWHLFSPKGTIKNQVRSLTLSCTHSHDPLMAAVHKVLLEHPEYLQP